MTTHRELETIFKRRGATVVTFPDGWTRLLADLHNELTSIDPEYTVQVVQVDVTGRLEFDLNTRDIKRLQPLLRAAGLAEHRSKGLCEVCGKPGRTAPGFRRPESYCDTHGDFD